MAYQEGLSIILMRDNGPRKNYHLRRKTFLGLLLFFTLSPLLGAFLAWGCWHLWTRAEFLAEKNSRLELELADTSAKLDRLENLESLLQESAVPGRDIILRRLAARSSQSAAAAPQEAAEPGPQAADEGPGHEEFPAIDSGRIQVSNVQARAMRGNTLRIGLDLRNPENEQIISGIVRATLLTADGQRVALQFEPADAGAFRISRFKRAVLVSRVERKLSLIDASVILEVAGQDGDELYRNIFAVER